MHDTTRHDTAQQILDLDRGMLERVQCSKTKKGLYIYIYNSWKLEAG